MSINKSLSTKTECDTHLYTVILQICPPLVAMWLTCDLSLRDWSFSLGISVSAQIPKANSDFSPQRPPAFYLLKVCSLSWETGSSGRAPA
jgi:hypothetical protein